MPTASFWSKSASHALPQVNPPKRSTLGSVDDPVREIERLLFRYAECVDRADYAGLGELFARGELRADAMPEPLRGAEAVERFYARTNRVHDDGTARTKHLVSNIAVDVAGDQAEARSHYVVYQATPRLPLQPIIAGRYTDRFRRDAQGWYFAERWIHVDLVGDLSEHLAFDPNAALGRG